MNNIFIQHLHKHNQDNEFIGSLIPDTTRPDLLKQKEVIYKLTTDGSNKGSDIAKIEEAALKNAIFKLDTPTAAERFGFGFDGTDSIMTLFRYYSLLVHRDSMARENFIRYFDKNTLANKAGDFMEYVAEMGKMPQEEAIADLTEALYWVSNKPIDPSKEMFDLTKLADLLFDARLLKHKRRFDKKHKIQLTKVSTNNPNDISEQVYEVVLVLPSPNEEDGKYVYKPNSRKYYTIFGNRTSNRSMRSVSQYNPDSYEFKTSEITPVGNDERKVIANDILQDC